MKHVLLLILIALCCWNCQEDKLAIYDGQNGIYFINLYGPTSLDKDVYTDTTSFSFAFVTKSDTVIHLGVRAMGDMMDFDRPFQIKVNSTATAGVHYDELQSEYILPAGNTDSYVPIHIYRENIDADTTFYIEVQLIPNEYFHQNMSFKEITNSGVKDTIEITRHVLAFSNDVSEPQLWSQGAKMYLGELFTEAKFNFVNTELNINPGDWYSSNTSLWNSIMTKLMGGSVYLTNYLNSLIKNNDYVNYPKDPDNTNPADKGYLTFPDISIPADWPNASEVE